MKRSTAQLVARPAWNRGKLVGQKAPLKLKEIWAVRVRLQLAGDIRQLALFDLAIDNKLRACDLVGLHVRDIAHGTQIAPRASVVQRKTLRPVQFEITPQTREALTAWVDSRRLQPDDYLFPSRQHDRPHLSTRQYARMGSTPFLRRVELRQLWTLASPRSINFCNHYGHYADRRRPYCAWVCTAVHSASSHRYPAKKVCNAWAGSALMRDPALVAGILQAVVNAVDVPVTLKIRTGWATGHRNALEIARIAEAAGIAALAVHGRTRDQQYKGLAEYDTIAEVKAALLIPVMANGDIDSPQKAAQVLRYTGCDAVLVGRAAQGRPWIFRQIGHYLASGELLPAPGLPEVRDVLLRHLHELHAFYGEVSGVRIARKHLGWYAKDHPENAAFRAVVNQAETADLQLQLTRNYFDALIAGVRPELPAAA